MSKPKVKVKLHHTVKDLSSETKLVSLIVDSIKEQFPDTNLRPLKHNLQLINDIMNCVESCVKAKTVKKKDIVLQVFHTLFDDDTEDPLNIDMVSNTIEYVCSNKLLSKHTKVANLLKLFCKVFFEK